VFPVHSTWTDAELASIPCAYGTAENLILRARLSAEEHVLITGASGGVGTAAVQLAKRRGALVTAIAAQSKFSALRSLGADRLIDRDADIAVSLGEDSVNLVIDNVAGRMFPQLLRVLRRGGRYASSGAIAGALVALDLRTLYLKDLTLLGCTAWDPSVFPNLVRYIERGEIRPIIAKTFPLAQIADAQREFLEKKHVGKLVLIPPAPSE
jgi:NADPH:quinone reductase-like Zn-dependent oxidoreductase